MAIFYSPVVFILKRLCHDLIWSTLVCFTIDWFRMLKPISDIGSGWMGWIGIEIPGLLRAPLCGANNFDNNENDSFSQI